MNSDLNEPVSVWRLLNRHKWRMLLAFLAVNLAVAVWTALASPKFTSEGKVFVRLGKESVGLDPTAMTGQVVGIQATRESEINSVVDLLESRAIRERVVDEIGAEPILGEQSRLSAAASSAGRVLDPVNLNPLRVYSYRDKAVEQLGENLGVHAARNSSIITLTCMADRPDLAKRLLELVIEYSRESHIRANRAEGSRTFFEAQNARLKQELEDAEQELLAVKNARGLADWAQQRQIHLEQLGTLREEFVRTENAAAGLEAEVSAIEQTLRDPPQALPLVATAGIPLMAASEMRSNLYDLELREKELTSKYRDEHFALQQLRSQIEHARTSLAEESRNPELISGFNEGRGGLEQTLLSRTAQLASFEVITERLREQVQAAEDRIEGLNQDEVVLARLQRRVDLATTNYRTYADKLEQTRIDEALSRDNISNINVLQEPSFTETPSSPRVKLNLAVGFVLAMLAALTIPAVSSVRSSTRPVVLQGPQTSPQSDSPGVTESSPDASTSS